MSESVLLVEDNALVLAQLNQTLTTAGYQVTTAVNGLDGYNKAQQHRFDLCIVDHLMPLMNGPQLVKNLIALGDHAPSSIIFLTTQDLKLVNQISEVHLADKVLTKPISNTEFLAEVSKLKEYSSEVA
ncbi:response regulator [Thalassotalea psychrophila]|uniref:Response regulator n=1 Tax=Thalassotalea psychrophila TaxID=3065647 RepID=A0ABY9TYA0_9GAMM|nr:response regulator [Colwelliaceae bacterium SQ149]